MGHLSLVSLRWQHVLPAPCSPAEVEEAAVAISIRPHCSTRRRATKLSLAPVMLHRAAQRRRTSMGCACAGAVDREQGGGRSQNLRRLSGRWIDGPERIQQARGDQNMIK